MSEAAVTQIVGAIGIYILGQGAVDAVEANASAKKYDTYVSAVTTTSGENTTVTVDGP